MNKSKQAFYSERGYTLVEVIGVLFIMGLIITIALTDTGGLFNRSKDKTDKANIRLIEEAAMHAYIDELEFDSNEGQYYEVPTLAELNYLRIDENHEFNRWDSIVVKTNNRFKYQDLNKVD